VQVRQLQKEGGEEESAAASFVFVPSKMPDADVDADIRPTKKKKEGAAALNDFHRPVEALPVRASTARVVGSREKEGRGCLLLSCECLEF